MTIEKTNKMDKKFWKPSITSQFMICPIPYHMDTYRGCVYNCLYCFARDFVTFSRRNAEHKEFSYLFGNRADLLDKWIERTIKKEYDYDKAEEVALKERIPIKIGATADPFPFVESEEKVTYSILKVFEKYDYPIEIQTKNPKVLSLYSGNFNNPNWVVAVTLISTDEKFISVIEPNAPSPIERLSAIKKLTNEGKKVMVKIQPSIYPKILNDLPDLVKNIKDSGCFGFNVEGLKIRTTMPQQEQELFKKISSTIGYDLREYYIKNGVRIGSDYEMTDKKKMEYIKLANDLAIQYELKFYVADNYMGKIGTNDECCGTEVLRGYKKWGNNFRTSEFGCGRNCSEHLGKCKVNFTRNTSNQNKTMDEVVNAKRETKKTLFMLHNSFEDKGRIYKEQSPTITTPSGGGHLPYVVEQTEIVDDTYVGAPRIYKKECPTLRSERNGLLIKQIAPKIYYPHNNSMSDKANTLGSNSQCITAKTGQLLIQPILTPDRVEKRQNGRRLKEDGEDSFTLTSQDVHGVMIKEATKEGFAVAKEGDSINLSCPDSETRRGRVGKGQAQTLDTGMQQYTLQNTKIRRLTPVECERLQGFPDGWTEGLSDSQRYKCLGNAVTVKIVELIATRLKARNQ